MTLPILIVDDDADTRALLSTVLARSGFETIRACDGNEAIARLRERRFAAVILDLLMPQVNGFEVLHYLKATERQMLGRVIVLTAAGDQTLQHFDASAVCAVLHKPVDTMKIVELARQCAGPPELNISPRQLRERRLALGWSIDQLASKVGVSGSLLAEWERGVAPVSTPAALEQILSQAEPARRARKANRARKLKVT